MTRHNQHQIFHTSEPLKYELDKARLSDGVAVSDINQWSEGTFGVPLLSHAPDVKIGFRDHERSWWLKVMGFEPSSGSYEHESWLSISRVDGFDISLLCGQPFRSSAADERLIELFLFNPENGSCAHIRFSVINGESAHVVGVVPALSVADEFCSSKVRSFPCLPKDANPAWFETTHLENQYRHPGRFKLSRISVTTLPTDFAGGYGE